jgi:ankyrin repeat protein
MHGHARVVPLLLGAGADKDAQDEVSGCGAQCGIAVRFPYYVALHLCCEQKEKTALMLAAEKGRADAVMVLLDAGADKDAKDEVRASYDTLQ